MYTTILTYSLRGRLAMMLEEQREKITSTLKCLHSVRDVPEGETRLIRLLHPSFRDCLLDPKRCSNRTFSIDAKDSHSFSAAVSESCQVTCDGVCVAFIDREHGPVTYQSLTWTRLFLWLTANRTNERGFGTLLTFSVTCKRAGLSPEAHQQAFFSSELQAQGRWGVYFFVCWFIGTLANHVGPNTVGIISRRQSTLKRSANHR
jgi:hypothetical protein